MLVKVNFGDRESQKELSKKFGLGPVSQDWDLVNASPTLVDDFIKYFNETEEEKMLISTFELIIASIDEIENPNEKSMKLKSLYQKVADNPNNYINTIIYWSCLGKGTKDIFPVSLEMREFLNSIYTKHDKFEILENEIYGVQINDSELLEILESGYLNVTFEEFLNSISENVVLKISNTETLNVEIENEYTHFYIYGSNENHHYFRFQTNEFLTCIKKYRA